MIALTVIAALWGVALFVFTVAAWNAVRRVHRRARRAAGVTRKWPAIAILRPCEGPDAELYENLLSTVTARYDGAREVLLLVPQADDPAYAVCERVKAEAARVAPDVPVEVVLTRLDTPANRKVAQLAVGATRTQAPVLVVADSDLRLDDDTLPSLLAVLEADPKAGASSAPMVEVGGRTAGDVASAALLSSTPHAFLCLAGLAERSGGAHALCGALIAVRRAALEEVGGFAALEQFLGEDFELARRLHERGYTIPHSAAPARATDHGRSLGQVVRRYVRWSTVTRKQRAHLYVSYPLLLGATPLVLAVQGAALALGAPWAWGSAAAVGVAVSVRVLLAATIRRAYGLSWNPLVALGALLAGETLMLVTAGLGLVSGEIEWRGKRYVVRPGGRLERIGAA